MFFGSLSFIFEVMLYVGLGLPLVNLLASVLSGIGGNAAPEADADLAPDAGLDAGAELDAPDLDLDLDAAEVDLDLELDGADLDAGEVPAGAEGHGGFFLRFNLYCLCLAFVVMGAVGLFALETLTGAARVAVLIGGVLFALAAYLLLYRFVVWPLKRNDAHALRLNELRFRHARVTFRITKDSPGTIETRDAVGAVIGYRAQIDPEICTRERIEEGEEVMISDIDKEHQLCYVIPAERKILK